MSTLGLQNVTHRTRPMPPAMDTTAGMAAEMKREPVDKYPSESGEEATDTEYEAHNASIKNRLERLMKDKGVTNLARRRAMCQKVMEKVEMYFAAKYISSKVFPHRGPMGKWPKNIEAFVIEHIKEIIAKYKHIKAK